MKTRLLFLFAATLLSISARAGLLVYREAERAHVTVAGREVTLSVTTFIFYNTATASTDVIGAFKVGPNKYYAISNNTPAYVVRQGIAGRLGNYTVFARTANSNDNPDVITSMYFVKGRESTLDLGNGSTATFPRSLKAVTRALQSSSGNLATYESSSTLDFPICGDKEGQRGR